MPLCGTIAHAPRWLCLSAGSRYRSPDIVAERRFRMDGLAPVRGFTPAALLMPFPSVSAAN